MSTTRGWYLLSLCLGCFPPSEKFEKYLENYILNNGLYGYQTYCWLRLKKICKNRNYVRAMPPCGLELTAAKIQTYIPICVMAEDQRIAEIQVESATLISEIIESVATFFSLKHTTGFNLYRNGYSFLLNFISFHFFILFFFKNFHFILTKL